MRQIRLKLDEHIKRLGVSQKEFAEMCGLREATVSQLVNNRYDRIQLSHLLTVMDTLGITDFNDLFAVENIE